MDDAAASWVADPSRDLGDAALLGAVRRGNVAAYGVLYERHVGAARGLAGVLGATGAEREDLIAESFTRVLRVLRAGNGPADYFRPYLFTTMRNAMISWHRRDSAVSVVAEVPDTGSAAGRDAGPDASMDRQVHAAVAADAFASLPERWRVVLWRTEVADESPAQIASLLSMTPNAVAALAYRAREGLRRAYLEQYLPSVQQRACRTRACRAVVGQLAGWARHGCPPQRTQRITTHLNRCGDCRELATDLIHLNRALPALGAPHSSLPPYSRPRPVPVPALCRVRRASRRDYRARDGSHRGRWVRCVRRVVARAGEDGGSWCGRRRCLW